MVQITSKMLIIVIITIALYAAFVIFSDISLLVMSHRPEEVIRIIS